VPNPFGRPARARRGRNAQFVRRKNTQRAIDIDPDAPLAVGAVNATTGLPL